MSGFDYIPLPSGVLAVNKPDSMSYVPVEPLTQYEGYNLYGALKWVVDATIKVNLDQNHVAVEKLSDWGLGWLPFVPFLTDPKANEKLMIKPAVEFSDGLFHPYIIFNGRKIYGPTYAQNENHSFDWFKFGNTNGLGLSYQPVLPLVPMEVYSYFPTYLTDEEKQTERFRLFLYNVFVANQNDQSPMAVDMVKSKFKIDANMVPVEIFSNGEWVPYTDFLNDPVHILPVITERIFTEQDKQELALNLAASGMFKPKTEYLIIGDEVKGVAAVNFKTMLDAATYGDLKKYLTLMPRQLLWDFFMKKIYPGIPWAGVYGEITEGYNRTSPLYGTVYRYKSYQDLVWAGLIDLFNVANLEYINANQVDAIAWEAQKTEAYFTSQSQPEMDALQTELDQYSDVGLLLKPEAKAIMDQFATLPKLGDLGLEINRQNAIKELLRQEEYDVAQAVVDAYRYAESAPFAGALKQPLPGAIIGGDGKTIVQKSTV